MKLPKTTRRYCAKCKKHTEHQISQAKKTGKRGTLKRGSIPRAKGRGAMPGTGNKNRWGSKPTKPKRSGAKKSKKTDLRYKCAACNKISVQKKGFRAKKILIE